MARRVHDFVAVGLGPFNLGLACLSAPLAGLSGVVLEARSDFRWHPGMLLPDATLQVPFLADLVSLADPTSPYSFLAYLKDQGRLYPYYIRESFYPLRSEYDDYCRWAVSRLRSVEFDREVQAVTYDETEGAYVVESVDPRTGERHRHLGEHLVLGTGTPPYVPPALRGLDGPAVHSSDYLARREELRAQDSVTVVGSGQSAAEIFHDLLGGIEDGYALSWVTRSPRFFPLEYTKLTLEMTSPEYARHFHGLPEARRDALLRSQAGLYKGISGDLVDAIYDLLYAKHLHATPDTRLLTNVEVTAASHDGTGYTLTGRHTETDEELRLRTGAVVLATGYRAALPEFLAPVRDRIRWDERGRPDVHAHYAIDHAGEEIFVQNAEVHTHGFVAPDLGMGAYRNSVILARILGDAPYPVEERIAFQEFGVPADLRAVGVTP